MLWVKKEIQTCVGVKKKGYVPNVIDNCLHTKEGKQNGGTANQDARDVIVTRGTTK